MELLDAIILGLVQGATEFLPISSSGHLKLGQALLDVREPSLLFDITLHLGTLLSVMFFYRADILEVIRGMYSGTLALLREKSIEAALEPVGMRLAMLVLLATIPTGVLGLLLDRLIDPKDGPSLFTPKVVCLVLLVNGVILMTNRWLQQREIEPEEGTWRLWNINPGRAILIGIAQGMAVLPGISRSGSTITAALALGVDRNQAARYSFLLMIPAIVGALILKFDIKAFSSGQDLIPFLLGAAVAGITGYFCLIVLTRMLERAQFHHFAWYCWIVGGAGYLLLA